MKVPREERTSPVYVSGGPRAGWHDRATWERLRTETYPCCGRSVLGWHKLRCPVAGLGVIENWTCWLCGGAVDPASYGSDGPSIDHVQPRAYGGNDAAADGARPANHRLAHRSCNSDRGAPLAA